jgi:hypothetical protein
MRVIAAVYLLADGRMSASSSQAARYRRCSKPAFPADPVRVHVLANDGATAPAQMKGSDP